MAKQLSPEEIIAEKYGLSLPDFEAMLKAQKEKLEKQKKRETLLKETTELISKLKEKIKAFLPLQGDTEPGQDIASIIKQELAEAGLSLGSAVGRGGPRGRKGKYKQVVPTLFESADELPKEEFFKQLAEKCAVDLKTITTRYVSLKNREKDGFVINGNMASLIKSSEA